MKQIPTHSLIKTPWAQRHSNPYGVVKTRGCDHVVNPAFRFVFFSFFVDLGCHVGAHWILKGVFNSTIFEEKKRSQKRMGETLSC